MLVFQSLVESVNRLLTGEYPTSLKQLVLKFLLVLASVRSHTHILHIISSPEHEVLMVSYCGQWLSVVRRRASSVVRRPSTFDVYTLETTFVN